jgi:hypothetical protein
MALITLPKAKAHLRVAPEYNDDDNDIDLKLEQASAIILDRCNSTEHWRAITATWTDATVPRAVQAAMLLMLTHLYEHRGDDMQPDADLWKAIDGLIGLHKDPVLA